MAKSRIRLVESKFICPTLMRDVNLRYDHFLISITVNLGLEIYD